MPKLTAALFPALALSAFVFVFPSRSSAGESEEQVFSGDQPKTLLTQHEDFDRTALMAPGRGGTSVSGLSFANPNRFAMHQSYTASFSSGSFGSQSAGVYLNTLSYKLFEPLTLSADVGFYTPFYSSVPGMRSAGIHDASQGSSMIFPHVGLEYKPSKNTTVSLHLFNGPDAAKAYGYDSFMYPWAR